MKDGWPSFKKETVCSVTLVLANSSLRLLKEICGKTYLFWVHVGVKWKGLHVKPEVRVKFGRKSKGIFCNIIELTKTSSAAVDALQPFLANCFAELFNCSYRANNLTKISFELLTIL